jgi:S1-C subfamily serine protease
LAINLFANPSPKLIPDVDTRQFYLGLTFNVEFNLFVPGQQPFATSFEVPFEEKVPLVRGKDNFYDGMVAYTYEETAVRLAESLFPKQQIERRVRLIEAPTLPGQMGTGNGARKFTATGFCLSTDGYIATAHHFAEDAKTFKVNTKNGKVAARLVVSDPEHDLAILKAEGSFPSALALRSSETVKLGESIAVVGFPQTDVQGREPKIGRGEVASLSGMRDDASMFQISAPVQPGNSGGPLLDLHGNVVGVVVALLRDAQAVNYAVKSSHLSKLCERIPELRNMAPQRMGAVPSFEDMLDGVLPATLLLEGYP